MLTKIFNYNSSSFTIDCATYHSRLREDIVKKNFIRLSIVQQIKYSVFTIFDVLFYGLQARKAVGCSYFFCA